MKIDLDADDIDPNIVAGLLKQYLRELPGNLLTQKLQHVFVSLIGKTHSTWDLVKSWLKVKSLKLALTMTQKYLVSLSLKINPKLSHTSNKVLWKI